MKLAAVLLLTYAMQDKSAIELVDLRDRAAAIDEQERSEEITTEQARRRVQLLVRDFEAWAEAHDAELELKTRTHAASGTDVDTPLGVNRCSLFFEDSTDELCLIDLKRTEVWGASVLFCRYLCE